MKKEFGYYSSRSCSISHFIVFVETTSQRSGCKKKHFASLKFRLNWVHVARLIALTSSIMWFIIPRLIFFFLLSFQFATDYTSFLLPFVLSLFSCASSEIYGSRMLCIQLDPNQTLPLCCRGARWRWEENICPKIFLRFGLKYNFMYAN